MDAPRYRMIVACDLSLDYIITMFNLYYDNHTKGFLWKQGFQILYG